MISRRNFIKTTSASLALAGFPIQGQTKELANGKVVVIILEGGLDGLVAVPPIGDKYLLKQRKQLVSDKTIKLNPFFAIHPNLGGFANMLNNNQAFVVHATSFPYIKRSHFEGQNVIESGDVIPFNTKSGWLGRSLELAKIPGQALSIDMPLLIRGTSKLDNYYPVDWKDSTSNIIETSKLLSTYYKQDIKNSFNKINTKYKDPPAFFARDAISLAKHAGKELSLPSGPSAAVIRVNEFDTHAQQGVDNGKVSDQLQELDNIFIALKQSLQSTWDNTIILTLTEFGRTVKMNGSSGTDHGYGTASLLAGGLLNKSGILTQWPGLSNNDLFEGRDLMATIDFRSICAACIEKAYGLDHDIIADKVFFEPNLTRHYDKLFG